MALYQIYQAWLLLEIYSDAGYAIFGESYMI